MGRPRARDTPVEAARPDAATVPPTWQFRSARSRRCGCVRAVARERGLVVHCFGPRHRILHALVLPTPTRRATAERGPRRARGQALARGSCTASTAWERHRRYAAREHGDALDLMRQVKTLLTRTDSPGKMW
jgi:hypothetical protein